MLRKFNAKWPVHNENFYREYKKYSDELTKKINEDNEADFQDLAFNDTFVNP